MTPTTLAETILRDVPRYECWELDPDAMRASTDGRYIEFDAVLAALTAAMDPAIAERAAGALKFPDNWRGTMGLKQQGHWANGFQTCRTQAADLITALLTANAALRAERDDWAWRYQEGCDTYNAMHFKLEAAEAQIAALTARVEGLTGALEHEIKRSRRHLAASTLAALEEARAALSATTEEGK